MTREQIQKRKLRVYIAAPFRRHTNEMEGRQYGQITDSELIYFFERIEKVILDSGFETCLPHRDKGSWGKRYIQPADVAKMCFDSISDCDIVVVLAERSRGVHIEIGFAAAAKKPLLIFLKEGEVESGFYAGLDKQTKTKLVRYKDEKDLSSKLRIALANMKPKISLEA
jgi:nucleoside 2-deoxyribosyltransferase